MLLEFKVGNFLSFKDVTVLRMASVRNPNCCDGTSFDKPSDLMLIYGANGSGKSNLIKAITFAKDVSLKGSSEIDATEFHGLRGPSYFEFVIELDGTIYSYGFEIKIKNMELHSEWLYNLKPEGDICLYEYEKPKGTNSERKKRIHCKTKMNSDNDSKHFLMIKEWLEHHMFIENSRMKDEIIPVSRDILELLSSNLYGLDTGIVSVDEEPFTREEIPHNLIKRISNRGIISSDGDYLAIVTGNSSKRAWLIHIICENGLLSYRNISLFHENGYSPVLNNESLGTMRIIQILALMSMLIREDSNDGLIIMDEIECSVHTLVVEKLVELFKKMASDKGQLISTTHKANLLRNKVIEDDSISFIDRDRFDNDGSRLYRLCSMDHKMNDRHRAYMDGRMAAVPFFADHND